MGLLSIIRKQKIKDRELRVLMLGLDNAGKSTIVRNILKQDLKQVVPTMGFEIKTVRIDGFLVNIWDIGGQKSLRNFWFNYFDKLDGIIWVIDLSNLDRLKENFNEMFKILNNEKLMGIKMLIYLNKIDLVEGSDSGDSSEKVETTKQLIVKELKLDEINRSKWEICACSGISGFGIMDGMKFLLP